MAVYDENYKNALDKALEVFKSQMTSKATTDLDSAPREKSLSEQSTSQDNSQPDAEATTHNEFDDISSIIEDFDTEKEIKAPEKIGGMFARGYVNWLVGQSGGTKSWQELRWCRDISRGGEIFGGFAHNEPPRKCVILAGELPADEMRRRGQLLDKGGELSQNKENLKIIDLKKSEAKNISLMLDTDEGKKNIEKIIRYVQPDIIFIDSLISFFDGNESKYEDMKPVVEFLERFASKHNIAVVIIHHIRKRLARERMSPLNQDDVIGSSTILRKAANVIGVEFNRDTKTTTVTCLKSWFREFEPFTYKLTNGLYAGLRMEINLNPDTLTQSTKSTSNAPDWKPIIMAFLQGKGKSGATTKEINDALDSILGNERNSESLYTQLKRMYDNGEIDKLKRGTYSLPENKLNNPNSESNSNPNSESNECLQVQNEYDNMLSLGFDDDDDVSNNAPNEIS